MNQALGLIEVVGFGCAVNVSDVMVKTANVTIVGIERAKGSGWLTVKVLGDVGAVNAAVESGEVVAKKDQTFIASKVIPRLGEGLDIWLKKGIDASTEKNLAPKIAIETPTIEVVESELISKDSEISLELTESENTDSYTCNLCKDTMCTRKKGEPRKECSHYEELKDKEEK
ncbi:MULTISPECIES: BMC domain-containing protein [Vagococcus]|uniref:Propanediol utilization polyhedral body protein PduA n=1 Tax=Vagococcus fluvialis bH819 TaxID=1255619 RepID=A0A1X6WQ86_9ENTE|nr:MULTISPECIES: BMC domain-containing protein [Vagococcus]SLM86445.1 Propanediol utilization polyhedral body protein PduA [Vagococcus fluvialis bH819]HCM90653.1 BMC domain-containing protein [Vagococcus sp.]